MATIYRHWFPCTITFENPHGKGYTGYTHQTIEERDKKRWRNPKDSVGLKRAIVEYGIENMQTDTIEEILPIHHFVCEREKYWVAHFDDFHNGCNLTIGGNGFTRFTHTPESRQKISEANSGQKHPMYNKKHTPETIAKISGENHHCYGRTGDKHPMFGNGHLIAGEKNGNFGKTGDKHPTTRPEYAQAYWEFILLYPLGIKEARQQLREKFSDIPYMTIYSWVRKWQAEFQTAE